MYFAFIRFISPGSTYVRNQKMMSPKAQHIFISRKVGKILVNVYKYFAVVFK
jgi:hypothetical protein